MVVMTVMVRQEEAIQLMDEFGWGPEFIKINQV